MQFSCPSRGVRRAAATASVDSWPQMLGLSRVGTSLSSGFCPDVDCLRIRLEFPPKNTRHFMCPTRHSSPPALIKNVETRPV